MTALDPVLRSAGKGSVWISGDVYEPPPEDLGYTTAHVTLSRSDQQGFYQGISNGVLWPLLHSFPPTVRIGAAPWPQYVKANRAFAERTGEAVQGKDLVWIQDYHLMLVPAMVREMRPRVRMGWFCHVPWPNVDIFRVLPWRNEILEGLLQADVLGFHSKLYMQNFLDCVDALTPFRVNRGQGTVIVGKREVRVLRAPIGVPVAQLRELVQREQVQLEAERLRKTLGDRRVLLGVDRLDYTKGIVERLHAFERLLNTHREARSDHVLVQVMVPSRTGVRAYASLKSEVDRVVGDMNGRFGSTGRVPVQYLYRNLDPPTLFAHYLAADVALVTPLRDGMNLVAHEYVVAQASKGSGCGALVLSEFAGAAEYLKGAFLINPYGEQGLMEAIWEVSQTDGAELGRRMRRLDRAVEGLDVHRWAEAFMTALEEG